MPGVFGDPSDTLGFARKRLLGDWDRTRSAWKDQVAEAFHHDYIVPAEQQLRATEQQMLQVIQQAIRKAEFIT